MARSEATQSEAIDFRPIDSDFDAEGREFREALARSIKRRSLKYRLMSFLGKRSMPLAKFDEAIVIAHHGSEERFGVGFVKLDALAAQDFKFLPVNSVEEYDKLEHIWNDLTTDVDDMEKKGTIRGLLKALKHEFDEAQAVHERAQKVIAKYKDTEREADEVSAYTRKLLSQQAI